MADSNLWLQEMALLHVYTLQLTTQHGHNLVRQCLKIQSLGIPTIRDLFPYEFIAPI